MGLQSDMKEGGTMNERIKLLRKKILKMSMEDFGREIGITKSAISKLESGGNSPSEQTVKLICEKFNVRYEWLTTGNGDPLVSLTRDEAIAKFVAEVLSEEGETFQKTLIRNLSALTLEEWKLLEKIFTKK